MPRPYRKHTGERVPLSYDGVQLNGCYIPWCENFAVTPLQTAGRWSGEKANDQYQIGSSTKKHGQRVAVLSCRSCGTSSRLVSNQGVAEEAARLSADAAVPGCRNEGCANATYPPHLHADRYQSFGRTSAGAQRFRCRACATTCSVTANPTHRLRHPEITAHVLRLLVNKVPMRRICEVADIRPAVLYQRIGLLHERLSAYARDQEARFLERAELERLRVAIDRQDHSLMWGSAMDRQVFAMRAIATADTSTGYVLAQHLNYDPDENAMARELEARALGDLDRTAAFRRHARLWLPHEAGPQTPLDDDAQKQARRPDAEHVALAGRGAFVHETYTLMAHFLLLRRWFDRAARVHVSMDQEPAIARACALTFAERVLDGTLDAFFVRIDKSLSVPKRQLEIARLGTLLAEQRSLAPDRSEREIVLEMIAQRYDQTAIQHADPLSRWVAHPYATMQEPNREVLWLTALPNRSRSRILWGLNLASLRAVDRYFMQVRRKLSVLERPIRTSSTAWRAWHGYNAYSPRVVMQVLEIFRVVYNFHLAGQDRCTPAQRLGLTSGRVSLDTLIAGDLPTRVRPAGTAA